MHSFCINVGSVFTGYVGQISIFYPALPVRVKEHMN